MSLQKLHDTHMIYTKMIQHNLKPLLDVNLASSTTDTTLSKHLFPNFVAWLQTHHDRVSYVAFNSFGGKPLNIKHQIQLLATFVTSL